MKFVHCNDVWTNERANSKLSCRLRYTSVMCCVLLLQMIIEFLKKKKKTTQKWRCALTPVVVVVFVDVSSLPGAWSTPHQKSQIRRSSCCELTPLLLFCLHHRRVVSWQNCVMPLLPVDYAFNILRKKKEKEKFLSLNEFVIGDRSTKSVEWDDSLN